MENKELFLKLFNAKDETELAAIIDKNPSIFDNSNWKPLGENKSNYGVVKNQQANPIAALIEKVTNSIDAILTKECYAKGIDPKSDTAPKSMDDAIETFFPKNNWDLQQMKRAQAEEIQVIADGKGPRNQKNQHPTSVIIYDNGEGQHPEKFESTFLSLLRGNKNDIHFVQGKYNMGGSGAVVFCGKKRYQLIASKRYTNDGEFGFTLVREHPKTEEDKAKETWYEYLMIDGQIPSFPINELDLGLENRKFKTGTIIKLYSYQFPKGYSAFAQDLNQSINEYLFSPALPVLTKDTEERYPNNKVLVTDLYGLKRRLFREEEEYLEDKFSEDFVDELFGKMKVSCFVFKTKVKDYDLKRTKQIIQDRYFKNSMSVMFSLNGQVHGHYTSEFITRSLKLNLLKSHLLIHVDCTEMKYEFRKELFMASRDRLKDGEETQQLRWYLANKLSNKDGRLALIEKRRKQAVDIDTTSNTQQLLKNFTKNMPLDSDLMKLINQTFKLDIKQDKPKKNKPVKPKEDFEEVPFQPQRFPSQFKIDHNKKGNTPVSKIPLNGERTIKFSTDVENDYFDRVDEPGEFKIAVLNVKQNETEGGTAPGTPKEPTELFNVVRSSPHEGIIKLTLNPKDKLKVGDAVEMKVSLTAPGGEFDEIFMVQIVEPEKPKQKVPKPEIDDEPLGLPPLVFTYKDNEGRDDKSVNWEDVEEATGLDIGYDTVMIPEAEGDSLKRIFVNMESTVLMNFKSKYRNPNAEQIELANRKYYTSVYFHTLFLYTITKNRGYQIQQKMEGKEDLEIVDVGTYLKDVFDHYYSTFILNFGGMEEMMQSISE
jgi:DNA modification methylase